MNKDFKFNIINFSFDTFFKYLNGDTVIVECFHSYMNVKYNDGIFYKQDLERCLYV